MFRTATIVFVMFICGQAAGQGLIEPGVAPAMTAPAKSMAAETDSLALLQEADTDVITKLRSEATAAVMESAKDGDASAAFVLAMSMLADPTRSVRKEGGIYLEQAAKAGIVLAQVQLAGLLRTGGSEILPDPQRALDLLETAASSGNTAALLALGGFVLDTQLGKGGQERAIELIEKAFQAGDVDASILMGSLYAQGRGVPLDAKKAVQYYQMGMLAGSTPAMTGLGDLYRNGTAGVTIDPKKALALYADAASRGNLGAGRKIADMYLRGEGVDADIKEAVTMLEGAARLGDPQAYLALAEYSLRGDVLPLDTEAGIAYLEDAAETGYPAALLRLGELYRVGAPGLPANVNRAIEYYNEAVKQGAPGGERFLATVYLDPTQPLANPSRGIDLLKTAAASGDAQAAIRLGDLYSVNDLVQADYNTAKSYFDLALSYGNTNATVDLAQALVAGPLGSSHSQESLDLLTTAVESGLPGASTALARLQLAGTFPGRGLDGVLTMLLESTRDGDPNAARFLLQLYREGYGLVLSPDKPAAENLLSSLEPVLGAEGVAMQQILLISPDPVTEANLKAISDEFSKLTRVNGLQVLEQLRRSNAHAYVYIVQSRLAERGIYAGPLHGTLDSRTIGAMRLACEQVSATRICDAGPLTAGAVQVIGDVLFSPPMISEAPTSVE